MTESMIVEAVRAAGGAQAATAAESQPATVDKTADPAAVERFQAAMDVQDTTEVDAVPFANEVSAAWKSAQANNQGILHRIRALTQLQAEHSVSAPEMVELQYEVANLAFQQEVVTKVADKTSNAIQTLVKNQ
ncbi:MAG: hypothetical protein IKO72_10510 [Kiritimatiellae bacterium]|nr:hypothetical protein [Kiritimatiellia bacterium]